MASFTRRTALLLVAVAPLAACTSWQRVNDTTSPNPEATLTQLFNPGPLYARLGRLVSSGQIPFIGSVAQLPGPGDSTPADLPSREPVRETHDPVRNGDGVEVGRGWRGLADGSV